MKLKRDLRYMVEPSDTTKVVRFHDFQGKEHSCQIRDYSRTGLSFVMEEGSLIFKIGDIIRDLRFYSQDREIFKGPAHIIHIQDEEEYDKLISRVGCSFSENLLDVYSIIRVDKVTRLQNEFLDFVQSMAIEEGLDPEFVNLTSRLHYVLAGFQEKIAKEEEEIKNESEELISILRETLRDLAYDALRDELSRYYDHLSKVTSRFTDSKLHYIHKEFFQKRLSQFLMKSKLFNRAFEKPLGYAGDYEMMNIIYRNDFEGDDVFSQVMNKIDCEGSGARAVRNRRSYLYDKIMKTVGEGAYTGGDNTLKVMSVACGPAMEMYDVLVSLKGKKLSRKVEFIGIDQDRNALDDAGSRIDPLCRDRDDFEVSLLEDNIKRLIVGREVNNGMYKGINLIYSAGLFDYLSERASIRLVNRLYNLLAPGGLLIIGNFGSYNPQRFIMEYGAEWYLFHRSEEDLKALASGIPEDASIEVEREPEGINLFLNIRKPD